MRVHLFIDERFHSLVLNLKSLYILIKNTLKIKTLNYAIVSKCFKLFINDFSVLMQLDFGLDQLIQCLCCICLIRCPDLINFWHQFMVLLWWLLKNKGLLISKIVVSLILKVRIFWLVILCCRLRNGLNNLLRGEEVASAHHCGTQSLLNWRITCHYCSDEPNEVGKVGSLLHVMGACPVSKIWNLEGILLSQIGLWS